MESWFRLTHFHSKNMQLEMSSRKFRPFFLGLNVIYYFGDINLETSFSYHPKNHNCQSNNSGYQMYCWNNASWIEVIKLGIILMTNLPIGYYIALTATVIKLKISNSTIDMVVLVTICIKLVYISTCYLPSAHHLTYRFPRNISQQCLTWNIVAHEY